MTATRVSTRARCSATPSSSRACPTRSYDLFRFASFVPRTDAIVRCRSPAPPPPPPRDQSRSFKCTIPCASSGVSKTPRASSVHPAGSEHSGRAASLATCVATFLHSATQRSNMSFTWRFSELASRSRTSLFTPGWFRTCRDMNSDID
eukprot:31380-Pelagococcus_subviridis.AAC.8